WGIAKGTDEELALKGIEALENFFHEIGLATTLKGLGIDDSKIEEMAEALVNSLGTIGNFVKIGKKEAIEIYRIALW
ncbi:MAG: iron-containing alcohol dehydrogenase, partial [Candidatus Micrarchaeota archaeon]|nr:iron-containing alcohol dehydrogenase [Candidatus Micrarchaeota archaeon]